MAIESWPAGFPLPQRDGYGYTPPELNQRTSFALGGRVRPLFSDGSDTFTAGVEFDSTQWAYFQGWYRYQLANGSKWFDMTLQAAGTLAEREVRFTGPPSYQLISPTDVRVSLPLETRTGTTMSQAEWDALNP